MTVNAVSQSGRSFLDSLAKLEPTRALTKGFPGTWLSKIATIVNTVWQKVLPYLTTAATAIAKFATSTLGVSVELLGASFVPILLARETDNKILSTALIAAGVLIAGAGGYFLCSSGVISSAISSILGSSAAI